ncbi:MAG TPA: CehA/McbA family metallohydrolase [Candidatus Baltobacteraceae bacterium]|nr:CehA/McbA family metallohydrolase [Candidatus Baltobacteraceae bacterium]
MSPALLIAALVLIKCPAPARAADSAPLPPPGAVEFAGRVARNYWYLFGPDKRADIEALNRDLRDSLQQKLHAGDDAACRIATSRAIAASERLLEQVKDCRQLVRLDLTAAQPRVSPSGPVEFPGDSGALLFEVVSGGNGVQYSVGSGAFTPSPWEGSLVALDAAARGTTYIVAGLENVPFGRTTVMLEIRRPGLPAVRLPLDVRVPAPGRLKVTVLSSDTGQPTPAMVRLMWRTDGLLRPPPNAIDFTAQFEGKGWTSDAERIANLPAPLLNEQFWCVPGSFDMVLAPGVWQIGVRRGVEHEIIFEDVTIRSGETVERTFQPRRWVDMPRRGWWSSDDHVHCRILSDADARRLMAWVKAEDVHLANVMKMGQIYRTFFEQRGFGPHYRVVDGDYVLVPGQEDPRLGDFGHVLAMNITSMVRDADHYFFYDDIFDAVHAQGGLAGYAHVNTDEFNVHRGMSLFAPRQNADFAEILQFNYLNTDLYYDFLNLGFKLTASAGSDVPWGGTIGEVRVYAYLGQKPFSADTWFEAFRLGHTFVSSGPMIEFQVDDALPGDEIHLAADRTLHIHARAWGDPKRMAPVRLEIVRHGEVLRAAESTDPKHPEADLDFTVQAGNGCWIAARARAGDGTSAHTTPVYVVRDGLRFWKFDGLQELLGARLASLAQIEQIIADGRRPNSDGRPQPNRMRTELALQSDPFLERVAMAQSLAQIEQIIGDAGRLSIEGKPEDYRYRTQLALQADALSERVALAKKFYDELRRTAETERERRALSAP